MSKKKELSPEERLMNTIFGNLSEEELAKVPEEKRPTETDILFNNALDLIIDLVEDAPENLCEIVEDNYPGWCSENCDNFNKTCLCKALRHYKKEGKK